MKIKNIIYLYCSGIAYLCFWCRKKVNGELTFYAAGDNCPGAEIAYQQHLCHRLVD
ncbi:hypothetical protein DICPUDRAFT_151291 [Dictyostelium purpureum]|uniref:Uncharacterized protein n=1 Tax=Dictyostelium purpureum TaxID=5786 RepID=F0ZIH1_DICPU|nr:uncharacterized protein DICPUDRAFT_151291 [Dictyostelium purpureum]EGC36260.1 hypothetical protein DICPUDRAFT_151291 [Dictyostelium purpureum]|eukprot:XP_003287206.1 hypothetical protein DICPUDRAFT_151291 [Dictyostelium purpureum]